jgi:hypothetical protein
MHHTICTAQHASHYTHHTIRITLQAISLAYRSENAAAATEITETAVKANKMAKNAIFGQLGAVKLKKSKMVYRI